VLRQVTDLDLSFAQVHDLSLIGELDNLQGVRLQGDDIRDIRPLLSLRNLRWLDLRHNEIASILGIDALDQLEQLTLRENNITDVTALKSWVLRTVIKGKRCDIGLGSFALVSGAEVRDQAHQLRKIARAGGDPLAERRQLNRIVPTFESAARDVHETRSATFKNEKHRKQWHRPEAARGWLGPRAPFNRGVSKVVEG
jgi:Leucine-rich repeat (LRR) protein